MLLDIQGQQSFCYTGGKQFDPALPAIVFIHGAQNDHSVWGLQSRYLAHHGFGVLAPDLPAHGRSKGHPLASIEAMRDWVLALMDAAGVQKAALVGHSMGALVALDAAGNAPDRVSKLAMLGIAYPMKVSDALLDASLNEPGRAADMVNIWSHSSLAPKPSAPGPGFWVMGMSQRLMQRVSESSSEPVFNTDFNACNNYAGGEAAAAAAAAARCPALFMLGSADMMTPPRTALSLRAAIADAEVALLPCGHDMMAEQPDAVLDGLKKFLQTRPG
ncbi:alpha/beta fold hydrolase [Lacisediminimonas profundi]|uniref:alpha/beta fold hydrolase n=1 Tax=Lacisediminimonas profundi TaxID=2603856 RepID=UPI00124AF1ED|nr:alpha/beta hydrolase [Lacisediminimonas profundi]